MGKFVFPVIWGTLTAGFQVENVLWDDKYIRKVIAGYTEW